MADSVFDKKSRVRPPRVHITYEVETGGAEVMKEIPFVMGVMSDLSGQPKDKLAKFKDRKFVDIAHLGICLGAGRKQRAIVTQGLNASQFQAQKQFRKDLELMGPAPD